MLMQKWTIDNLWMIVRSILDEYRKFGLGSVTAWGIKLHPGWSKILENYSIQQVRYVLGNMKRDGIVEATRCKTPKGWVNAYRFREFTKGEV